MGSSFSDDESIDRTAQSAAHVSRLIVEVADEVWG